MNILFHVEPLIEMQQPFWKEGWATDFARQIADSLLSARGHDLQLRIVLNEPLSLRFHHDRVPAVVLAQADLLEAFGAADSLEVSLAWQRRTHDEGQLARTAELYLRKLDGFVPDVIITFSAAPHLTRLFPDALLLHQEYSVFSRKPYPETWFFDPCGLFDRSFPNTFAAEIRRQRLSGREKRLLHDFKQSCQDLVRRASPFGSFMSEARSRHRALALLPLQFSGYVAFDAFVGHRSQYDFLVSVLERAPDGVGIVVTTHPEYNTMSRAVAEYLTHKYPHFIHSPDFETYHSPSQYLLADVDSVITVSSSVGLQALLWDRPVINPGGVWRCIAASSDVRDTPRDPGDFHSDERDAFLFWILTRYAATRARIADGNWLSSFLERGLANHRSQGVTADFYEPFPDVDATFADWTACLDPDVPRLSTTYSHDRAISLLRQKSDEVRTLEAQLTEAKTELARRDAASGAKAAARSPFQERESALLCMRDACVPRYTASDLEAEKRDRMPPEMSTLFDGIDRCLEAGSIAAEQIVGAGARCLGLGYPAHAEKYFAQAIAGDPGNSDALNGLGMTCLKHGDHRAAECLFVHSFVGSLDREQGDTQARKNLLQLYATHAGLLYPDTDPYMDCPCCGQAFPAFLPAGIPITFNTLCPRCRSLPRHRMLWMYLQERLDIRGMEGLKVLHLAPEGVLGELVASLPNLDRVTAATGMDDGARHPVVTGLPFGDDAFDAILCIDVLERVPDDHGAMRELHRILKPGGWGILQSPMNPSLASTYEAPNFLTPEARFRRFGRADRVRIYGNDYGERLRGAGFDLAIERYGRELSDDMVRRCGLARDEDIYLCRKR